MSEIKTIILRSPGTNCDQESGFAFEAAGSKVDYVHINQLMETPNILDDYQIMCLPGGFSYGDDIAAGRILAARMQTHLADAIQRFHDAGKLVLGICNGFQVLIKSGFLLPADDHGLPATLTWNDSGQFIDCWVDLKCDDEKCVFLRDIDSMYLPIAHAEGKFVARDEAVLDTLQQNHQLSMKYCGPGGSNGETTFNPNGSTADVAGICNDTGRIFGLMPHPERHIDPMHHPRWTRNKELPEAGDGLAIFRNAVAYFE